MAKKPHHTFIVHGEEEAALALQGRLAGELGFADIAIPEPHQVFAL
jgi:metallo-beta-lactamase family protein